MKFNFRIIKKDISKESWYDKDIFFDPYIEIVNMRCLDCSFKGEVEADILLECFNHRKQDFPTLYCPHCNTGSYVPEDVYDQIKGNFIYDVRK